MSPKVVLRFALAAAFAMSSAFAESTYEREMKQLRDQRDKGITEATKALAARYQQSLELVYRRALQAKDPSADVIRTELESLGPLRIQPLPSTAGQAVAAPAQLPRSIMGVWNVTHIGAWKETWEFKEDGTCAITAGTSQIPSKFCTWAKNKDKIEVRYPNGDITALDLPIKNGKMEGSDKSGGHLWLSKDK